MRILVKTTQAQMELEFHLIKEESIVDAKKQVSKWIEMGGIWKGNLFIPMGQVLNIQVVE